MDKITYGRVIVLSDVTDPQGKAAGPHSAVILTTKEEYESGKPIKAVVISSKLQYAPKDRMVSLPWFPGGHPKTGLSKASAAICDWVVTVDEDHILDFKKVVPSKYLCDIAAVINAAESTQS